MNGMKFEINLEDIFCDGDNHSTSQRSCDMADAIRQQAVNQLTTKLKSGLDKQIAAETSRVINEEIQAAIKVQMPAIMNDLLAVKYTPVDRWGDPMRGSTTFRQELVKHVHEQMVYKKSRNSYDNNAFTQAVDNLVDESLRTFKEEYNTLVDAKFTEEALTHATVKLKQRLGIKQ